MAEHWKEGGFGLYLHWPFCAAKCPYCDFNSHVADRIDMDDWQRAYLTEIDRAAELTPDRVLSSIYFGGGTPSLMDPGLVEAILDRISSKWVLSNDIEITLEANPSSIEAKKFSLYKQGGVNRVSMGIQALNDEDLRLLGRLHDTREAKAALSIARETFTRVNFDLIYARQNQTLAGWEAELTEALSFQPDHLSMYQLTIEDGTAFGDRYKRGKLRGLPSEDVQADMYFLTQDLTEAAGLPAYEVSNHAAPGQESRHNLIYWRAGDYVGIGPGAHGRVTLNGQRMATWTELSPARWLKLVDEAGTGEIGREALSLTDQAGEYLMMGLRTREGLDLGRYAALGGASLKPEKLAMLVEEGLLTDDGIHLAATPQGRAVLNAIITELLPD